MRFEDVFALLEWKEDLNKGNVLTHNTNLFSLYNILKNNKIEIRMNDYDKHTAISFDRKDNQPTKSNGIYISKQNKKIMMMKVPVAVEINTDKAIGNKMNRNIKKPIQIREFYNRGMSEILINMATTVRNLGKKLEFANNPVFKIYKQVYEGFDKNLSNQNKYFKMYFDNKEAIRKIIGVAARGHAGDELDRAEGSSVSEITNFDVVDERLKKLYSLTTKGPWREERLYQDIYLDPSYTTMYFEKDWDLIEEMLKNDMRYKFNSAREEVEFANLLKNAKGKYFKDKYSLKICDWIIEKFSPWCN
jgi:hypothetical protein